MYKDLIIFEKMYELNLWLFPMVNTFPKAQRFVLGQQIQTLALRITMGIMRANVETQKLPYLKQVSVELDMLRVLTRLAHELRFMSTKQYEFVRNLSVRKSPKLVAYLAVGLRVVVLNSVLYECGINQVSSITPLFSLKG